MDYRNILGDHLLSKSNIDFLVNKILSNFKISTKAISKCTNIITNNFNKYLDNIDRYPVNDIELNEAINFLNQKCYDDFTDYLSQKYPDKNLSKNPMMESKPYEEIIIISEEEKNKLLNQHKQNKNNMDDFLAYLTNPMILQMFNNLTMQCYRPYQKNVPKMENYITIDEILDANQLNSLLSKFDNDKTLKKNNELEKINANINFILDDTILGNKMLEKNITMDNTIIEDNKIINENIKMPNEDAYDLANLRKEDLPIIEKRINHLIQLKKQYLSEKNNDKLEEVENEKEKIVNAVKEYKTKLANEAKENENRINGISMTKRISNEANVEYLDLQFDPTNDYNDLKNIVIGFKTDNKILDITLVDYYIPFNSHNVTRFNNKFMVYFNNKVNRIIIPPGKYEIDILLNYIKNQANFLDFTVDENKIITIKNSMNIKFDMMIEKDTIFPVLGFNERQDNYKDKLFYSGSQAYNLKNNEKILFTLSGSTIDPLSLEFDKQITLNKILKKSRSGFSMKQMVLVFTDNIGQYYDFILPFKMCFKITYTT